MSRWNASGLIAVATAVSSSRLSCPSWSHSVQRRMSRPRTPEVSMSLELHPVARSARMRWRASARQVAGDLVWREVPERAVRPRHAPVPVSAGESELCRRHVHEAGCAVHPLPVNHLALAARQEMRSPVSGSGTLAAERPERAGQVTASSRAAVTSPGFSRSVRHLIQRRWSSSCRTRFGLSVLMPSDRACPWRMVA